MLKSTLFDVASLLFSFLVLFLKQTSGYDRDCEAAVQFLWEDNANRLRMENKQAKANWNYSTNLTEKNKKIMLETEIEMSQFQKRSWRKAASFDWKMFKTRNETVYRWFKQMSDLGDVALPKGKYNKLKKIIAEMEGAFSKTKVRGKNSTFLSDRELNEIFKESRDYDDLKRLWNDYRAAIRRKVKTKYPEYVKLKNEAARLNGFDDAGESWRCKYEISTLKEDVESLWKEIEPFYKQLHAYVRRKMIEQYPDKGILPNGPIPAHILGNIVGDKWDDIFKIVEPFPKKKSEDVSENMVRKKMTPLAMFKLSESFFVSLGLKPMTSEFWERSVIEKPKGREMVCHASASDFFDGKDFRIKMCTKVNMEDLITVHHEMGHIQYYQQYAHLPSLFRTGANPGFHEAVGDVLALSVSTSSHLRKIGLLECAEDDYETRIKFLMKQALAKVAFLPFSYLMDSWRWKIFGENLPEDLNKIWWEHRLKYQGLCPPLRRTNDDFDAASKYHIIADVPYIRYFVSCIIQFQFHKALCDAAGHVGHLYLCDIHESKEAGKLLSETLSLGSSVHWKKAMNTMTKGKTRKMDAQPLLEYFEPLIEWLKEQNKNEFIGWKSADPLMCPQS